MHVACCQFDIAWEDKPANFARVEAMVESAGLAPGTLLLLPEMFATGFSMNAAAIAESPDGPTPRFLAKLAVRNRIHVLGGVVLQDESLSPGKPFNVAMLFDPAGKLAFRYAKTHLFSFTGEPDHYQPGTGPGLFRLQDVSYQAAICYDLRFPEVFRMGPAAEVLLLIANWPDPREAHWLTLLRARAIENQAYVLAVNRCGADPRYRYSGRTQIIGPRGELIADAGDEEKIISTDLDLPMLREYRRTFPALEGMQLTEPDVTI